MKFSEITDAVTDLFTFCAPPVLGCLLAYGLWMDLLPQQAHTSQTAAIRLLSLAGRSVQQHHDALEPFGLNKLVPFLSLFLVIAFLFLVNRIMVLCARCPPHLTFRPEVFLWPTLTLKQKLLLFRSYPTAEHFNAAFFAALGQQAAERRPRSGLRLFLHLEMFVKFGAVVTELIAIDAWWVHALAAALLLKAFSLMGFWLACWIVTATGQLFEQQQQALDDWAAISRTQQPNARELLKDTMTAEEATLLTERVQARWWKITLVDTYRVTWLRRIFLRRERAAQVDPEMLRGAWNAANAPDSTPGQSDSPTSSTVTVMAARNIEDA